MRTNVGAASTLQTKKARAGCESMREHAHMRGRGREGGDQLMRKEAVGIPPARRIWKDAHALLYCAQARPRGGSGVKWHVALWVLLPCELRPAREQPELLPLPCRAGAESDVEVVTMAVLHPREHSCQSKVALK